MDIGKDAGQTLTEAGMGGISASSCAQRLPSYSFVNTRTGPT